MNPVPIKVLLVDDDEDDFIITRDLLAEIGPSACDVQWVNSYDRALEVIVQQKHDVCLIDFWLGAHNGLELVKEAKSCGVNVPMILLTGLEDDIDAEAMRAGAEDFLCKSQITAKSLGRSIRYAIERNRSEKEIQRLAAFPRTNPNPVLELDAQGTMIYSNGAAHKLALALGLESLLPVLPKDCCSIIQQCLLSGQNQLDTKTTLRNRTISWSFIPIPATQTVHCYASDITERLGLEAQLRHSVKMDAVGQLAAGVAHDFNNILTIIQGHADLLAHDKSLDPEIQYPLQQIGTAADRAGKLIRQLLMFSRKQVLQPRQVDLNEMVSNVSKVIQRLLGEQITLELVPASSMPNLYADVGMLEQALVNLAINARDAMPHGGRLTLSTKEEYFEPVVSTFNPDGRCGHFASLKVKDTGRGMDETILSHMFEPFFTTKDVGKGIGLGLATVYGIVKQHKGWIVVESQVGAGSTFSIFLPSLPKPDTTTVAPPPPAIDAAKGTETILVAEDEPALRELVVSILHLYGYKTYQAETGVAALEVWKQHKDEIDLLLTDMVMPGGVSGRQLAQKIHEEVPGLKVIYTSGYSPGMAGKDIALLEGFNFLAKPYPPSRLAHLIRQCLDSD